MLAWHCWVSVRQTTCPLIIHRAAWASERPSQRKRRRKARGCQRMNASDSSCAIRPPLRQAMSLIPEYSIPLLPLLPEVDICQHAVQQARCRPDVCPCIHTIRMGAG